MFRRNVFVGGGCAAALVLLAGQAMGQTLFTPIALTGTTSALGPNNGADVFTGIGNSFSMNNMGQVLFTASSTSTDVTANAASAGSGGSGSGGIWAFSGGSNGNVAAIGGTSLDGGTYNIKQTRNTTTGVISGAYPGFAFVHINDNLDFAFRENSGSDPSRYWSSAGATPGQMASTCWSNTVAASAAAGWTDSGTAGLAPGTGGGKFQSMSTSPNQLMNSAGQYLFVASMIGNATGVGVPGNVISSGASANAGGMWMGKPGAVSLVARQGDATSFGAGVLLGTFSTNVGLNASGNVIGLANLTGTGITTPAATGNATVLLSNRNVAAGSPVSTWETIARQGGTPKDVNGVDYADGTQYRSITATSAINNAGKVAFVSTLRNGVAGVETSFGALFSDTTGTMRAQAVKNGAMPASTGLAGLKWGGFYDNVAINGGGTVVFTASSLTDADVNSGPSISANVNDSGIFKLASNGSISTVVRAGPATYWDPGAVVQNVPLQMGEFVRFTGFSSVAMNALGQVAWISTLQSNLGNTLGSLGGPTGDNPTAISQRNGLFLTDLTGGINLIAQTGTLYEVAPGDLRIVQSFKSISQGAGEDGRQMSLDANGNFLFGLNFAITAGNPNATAATQGLFLVHVPAPGTGALLGLGGLVVARRRRR